jgi:hypothetical protein
MKQSILRILLLAAILSGCQKEDLAPAATTPVTTQSEVTTTPVETVQPVEPAEPAQANSTITGSLRVQLYKDAINNDGILIDFNPTASAAFVANEDAQYFQGNGMESLASLSSDNIPLAINKLPLPTQSLAIKLQVGAQTDGIYKLNLTAINSVPSVYDIWLMDRYKKDSLDMRNHPSYVFNIFKADANSYGSNRFSLVIRANKSLQVHLLDFTAVKSDGGTQVSWKTENEHDNTVFTVEKSVDKGQTFTTAATLTSSASGTYGYFDLTSLTGTILYRLKIIDFCGAITYSNVVTVNN